MASRVTLYGKPTSADLKRLKREFNSLYVDYDESDPAKDTRAARRLADLLGDKVALPLVEIQRADGDGSVLLSNPDEPTLRQSLTSENILSITAYWL